MRSASMTFALLSAALAASACHGGGETVVLLNGAGATFPNIIYQRWITDYNAAHPGVELNYQSIGSGGGIQQFTDGTVDFAGSDAPMTDEEMAKVGGNVLHIPTVLGAVVPSYNLTGVSQTVRFTPEALADIFLGTIKRWNDIRLASANPGVALPNQEIVVVHRSDGSGTSYIWTEYLSTVSSEWAERVGKGKSVNWPVGIGGKGNEGVSAAVQQTPGALGYVELGYAMINKMPVGAVRNRAGNFVTPDLSTVAEAAAAGLAAIGPETDFRVSLINGPGDRTYPVSSFTWLLVHKDYGASTAKAKALTEYISWALTAGQAVAPELGYAPLPAQVKPWIEARLTTVTAAGTRVWSGPLGR
jgi:phosphate transport system substrate-binding protein